LSRRGQAMRYRPIGSGLRLANRSWLTTDSDEHAPLTQKRPDILEDGSQLGLLLLAVNTVKRNGPTLQVVDITTRWPMHRMRRHTGRPAPRSGPAAHLRGRWFEEALFNQL
jgi:hypothetical protein